jgi:hypothetical protein
LSSALAYVRSSASSSFSCLCTDDLVSEDVGDESGSGPGASAGVGVCGRGSVVVDARGADAGEDANNVNRPSSTTIGGRFGAVDDFVTEAPPHALLHEMPR